MTDRRKREIEKLAREKAFTLVEGDTFSAIESDLISRQMAISEPAPLDDSDPDEPRIEPQGEPPQPTGPEEKEIYYRAMIADLAQEGKKARFAVLDIVKYLFNLSPDETAAFMLDRSGGAFGTIEYSALTDAVRELSKLPEAAAIRAAMKARVSRMPKRKKIPYGGIKRALTIVNHARKREGAPPVTERTFRRWINGTPPPGFPGVNDIAKLATWAADYEWKSQKGKRTFSGLSDEQQYRRRKTKCIVLRSDADNRTQNRTLISATRHGTQPAIEPAICAHL